MFLLTRTITLWDLGLQMSVTSLETMSPHSSVSGDCEEAIVQSFVTVVRHHQKTLLLGNRVLLQLPVRPAMATPDCPVSTPRDQYFPRASVRSPRGGNLASSTSQSSAQGFGHLYYQGRSLALENSKRRINAYFSLQTEHDFLFNVGTPFLSCLLTVEEDKHCS